MSGLPEEIATEIASKRSAPVSDDQNNTEAKPTEEKPKTEDKPAKDESKETDQKQKTGDKPKPKAGQSIAQVAEAAETGESDDDEDDEEPKGDSKKSKISFKDFIENRKEMKSLRRDNQKLAQGMEELLTYVKSLKGDKDAQVDEIEEFAKEWGLDKDGTKAMFDLFAKKLSTKFTPSKKSNDDDDEDDEDDEDEKPKPKKKGNADDGEKKAKLRNIELAIEGEYEELIDSYPQLKAKTNLKVVKLYIMSDKDNLSKSMHDIIEDMYPGILETRPTVDGGADGGAEDVEDKVDFSDPKVQARVASDPKMKQKYADDLVSRVRSTIKS